MNDHTRELRRYASVLGRPTIMLDAADEIERLAAKLEAAEKSDAESLAMYRKARDERDAYKTAFEEWHQKTGWVQQGINDGSIPPTYLGWHRADVMADMLKSARRDYCVLEGYYTELAEKLAAANRAVDEAYQRGYATGQEESAAELEFAKREVANLHDDISEWMDKCDALRARIAEMEKQEPVAWLHETRRDSDVVTNAVKCVWQRARPMSLASYTIPLYLAPGAQPAPSQEDESVRKSWARFSNELHRSPDAPYPGMSEAFEQHFSQSFTDREWRSESGTWAAAWKAAKRHGAQPAPSVPTAGLLR